MKPREYIRVHRAGSNAEGPWTMVRMVKGKIRLIEIMVSLDATSVEMVNYLAKIGWRLTTVSNGEFWFEGKPLAVREAKNA